MALEIGAPANRYHQLMLDILAGSSSGTECHTFTALLQNTNLPVQVMVVSIPKVAFLGATL